MWILLLNDMRASNIENVQPRACAETREALIDYVKRESVEHYSDGQWGKSFRQGGPLEWCNPPWNDGPEHFRDIGTAHDWAQEAVSRFDSLVRSVPQV